MAQNSAAKVFRVTLKDANGNVQNKRITLGNFWGDTNAAKRAIEKNLVGRTVQSIEEVRALTNDEAKRINDDIRAGRAPTAPALVK